MKAKNDNPRLSVILWTPDRYETLARAVQSLQSQTVRQQIEVILIAPLASALEAGTTDLEGFAGHQLIGIGPIEKSTAARAKGVAAARAPVVAFMQDHCFPVPGWAEALIKRYEEPWSGVGCVFRNANPQSTASWCNFLLAYGDWADPPPPKPPRHMGGHNASYRRDALLAYGDALPEILESSNALQRDLKKRGHRLTVEPEAKMLHENFSILGPSVKLHFHLGRVFGAKRAGQWPRLGRAAYVLAWPLIPPVRLARLLANARRAAPSGLVPRLIPAAGLLLLSGGLGEAAGAAAGPGRSVEWITGIEFHRHRFMAKGA